MQLKAVSIEFSERYIENIAKELFEDNFKSSVIWRRSNDRIIKFTNPSDGLGDELTLYTEANRLKYSIVYYINPDKKNVFDILHATYNIKNGEVAVNITIFNKTEHSPEIALTAVEKLCEKIQRDTNKAILENIKTAKRTILL